EQMHTIQHRYYIPNNSLLIIAGDVKPEEAFAEAEKYLETWNAGPDPFKEYPVPTIQPIAKSQLVVRTSAIPPQLAFVQQQWHGPSVGTDDKATFAADVFSYILNQSTSRFYKKMVESGLTMGIEVDYEQQRYVGPIAASMQLPTENLAAAIDTLHSEINHWDDNDYFTDDELATAKHILKVQHLYEAENTSNYAHDVSFFWASCGFPYMDHYLDEIEHITRQDIKNYVDTYIKSKNYVLGVGMSEDNVKKITLNPSEVLQ
ncbi:MAG TPA: insulinase family protein, partial [Candidatus Kapabacteria bacterium]|nr:insulinase family protein [Candidatus Kapabacteria bacterium]